MDPELELTGHPSTSMRGPLRPQLGSTDRAPGRKKDANLTWGWAVRSMSAINWFLGFSSWERAEASGAGEPEEGGNAACEIPAVPAHSSKQETQKDPQLSQLGNDGYKMTYTPSRSDPCGQGWNNTKGIHRNAQTVKGTQGKGRKSNTKSLVP